MRLHFDKSDLSPEKGHYDDKISELTRKTWSYVSLVCSKLNLIPFQTVLDGQVVLCSGRRLVIHYSLVALAVAIVARHLVVSISYLCTHGFDLNSIMSLFFLIYYLAAMSGGIASSFTSMEMMDLINSWQPQIDWIEEETGTGVSMYCRSSDNIKVILTTLIFHLLSMELAVISLVLEDLPATWYGFLWGLGLNPASSGVALLVRILLSPVELATTLATGLVGSYNVRCGALSLGLIRIYLNEMR